MKTCPKCSHFKVCSIIASFKTAIKKHLKVFRPSENPSPVDKLYNVVASDCMTYEEVNDSN